MTSADPRSRQLSEMAECAYRLGMSFGAATEKAQGTDELARLLQRFRPLLLRRAGRNRAAAASGPDAGEPREAATDREALIDQPDPPETAES